jgi:hypothetical protein
MEVVDFVSQNDDRLKEVLNVYLFLLLRSLYNDGH